MLDAIQQRRRQKKKMKITELVGKYAKKKKYQNAATRITKMWRGYKWRSLLGTAIKRIIKRHNKWQRHKKYHKAATKIASEWRKCVLRAKYPALKQDSPKKTAWDEALKRLKRMGLADGGKGAKKSKGRKSKQEADGQQPPGSVDREGSSSEICDDDQRASGDSKKPSLREIKNG